MALSLACFRDYAAIVFFANNRFETGKRKLQYLTFQDFAFCAGQLINSWTVGAVGELFQLVPSVRTQMYRYIECTVFNWLIWRETVPLNLS